MVVAIVERGTARQEIEIAAAAIVVHPHVGCLVELARHRPGIAADPRFAAFIDAPVRNRAGRLGCHGHGLSLRSEEHTSELQSLMRISYAVFCLKKKNKLYTII